MACARHLNLNQLPIVCVNVDGFYEPFRAILDHAYDDELIRLPPHEIVHFAPSAEAAVRWIEGEKVLLISDGTAGAAASTTTTRGRSKNGRRKGWKKRMSLIRLSSFFSASPYQQQDTSRSSSFYPVDDDDESEDWSSSPWIYITFAFVTGTLLGVAATTIGFSKKK